MVRAVLPVGVYPVAKTGSNQEGRGSSYWPLRAIKVSPAREGRAQPEVR